MVGHTHMHAHTHTHTYTHTQAHMYIHIHTGAIVTELGSSGSKPTTHLVVCDEVETAAIPHTSSRVYVVKQQWFWESIQIDACADERLYQARVCPQQCYACHLSHSHIETHMYVICITSHTLTPPH